MRHKRHLGAVDQRIVLHRIVGRRGAFPLLFSFGAGLHGLREGGWWGASGAGDTRTGVAVRTLARCGTRRIWGGGARR